MSSEVSRRSPPPAVVTFLPCADIFDDGRTGRRILLGPISHVPAAAFPAIIDMAVWVELTGARGEYAPQLQLLGPHEEVAWGSPVFAPWRLDDPLAASSLTFFNQHAVAPRPGRYRLVLLLNGTEVAQRAIAVTAVRHPQD